MGIRNYQDLLAWRKAMNLAQMTYEATGDLPREERYGLTAQMRRAAVSIPSNIAEGQGRRKEGAFSNHLSIAHGSVRELETQILLSERLGLIEKTATTPLLDRCAEVGRLITGLTKSLTR